MATVVVIDDETRQQFVLKTILEDKCYEVHTASSAEDGLKLIKALSPEVVITDINMGGISGIQLLDAIPEDTAKPAFIIMTAYGTISSAVEAMRKGAFDYLTKPLDKDIMLLTVHKAIERMQLFKENVRLQNALHEKFKIEGIVGESKKMQEALTIARKVSPTATTLVIYGESGTGKELFAKAIHYNSPRKTGPFVAINCAAIPENIIESELFGYEPGAFTGASKRTIGLIETANKGTLFLDEIGDLPMLTQTKLLRVLQDKEIRRLGGKDNIKIDVRIISATHRNLEEEVRTRRFRDDLYYRLKVATIELPSLRERREDIPVLVSFFIDRYNKEFGKKIKGVSQEAMKALTGFHWPGNIRHLAAVIEMAVLLADTDLININDIEREIKLPSHKKTLDMDIPEEGINFEELEKKLLGKAMSKADNVATKAAKLLGMSYKTFLYRLEKFGLYPESSNKESPSLNEE